MVAQGRLCSQRQHHKSIHRQEVRLSLQRFITSNGRCEVLKVVILERTSFNLYNKYRPAGTLKAKIEANPITRTVQGIACILNSYTVRYVFVKLDSYR